jgi:hypothetical protein
VGVPVTPVNAGLYRREPRFSLDLQVFLQASFLKSGSICPSHPAELAGRGKFCRVTEPARQFPPGRNFLPRAKSMFNQNLPPFGMSLANAHAGKTPKSNVARYPEWRDQNDF